MKKIDPTQLLAALAEMTAHGSRKRFEQSLLATLCEYYPSHEYWLYQVLKVQPDMALDLLVHSSSSNIVSSDLAKGETLPDFIEQTVKQVVHDGTVESVYEPDLSPDFYLIYPVLNGNKDVVLILIECTGQAGMGDQQMVHGLVRIFANYLDLIERSRRDNLTSLLNRETLESEITRVITLNNASIALNIDTSQQMENDARRHKGELQYWLGVLDIDHFKRINDDFGHLYGDEILIMVARLMESSVRSYDLVFRYGGEEFVILLKAADLSSAKLAFERIRTTVGHHNYAKVKQVTISIGVTHLTLQSGSASVIGEADKALYFAKEHGRDQVYFYHDLTAQGLIAEHEMVIDDDGVSFF